MSPVKFISSKLAPAAIGPYSQATTVSNFVYTSGCIPIDSSTLTVPSTHTTIALQTELALANLSQVLIAADSSMSHVVKTTVFLQNMGDFKAMNEVYERAFAGHRPARSTIEVARLPLNVLVEIEAVAVKKE